MIDVKDGPATVGGRMSEMVVLGAVMSRLSKP